MNLQEIENYLGEESEYLMGHKCDLISKNKIMTPSADWIDRAFLSSNRSNRVLSNLSRIYNSGRLAKTGYIMILPVEQGIEHSAGSSFARNISYFDPEETVKLAIEGGVNAYCASFGALDLISRKYAHKIPLIVKINHNELLSYPNTYSETMFGSVKNAFDIGCAAVGATIYFGTSESREQIVAVSKAFEEAHSLGMGTILWCFLRNTAFKIRDWDYNMAADLTAQANHLSASIGADVLIQKMPTVSNGYLALQAGDPSYGRIDKRIYTELLSDHPIDMCRYQIANSFMGKIGVVHTGGPSVGSAKNDIAEAVRTAVINKRAGGQGITLGRKAFQRPFSEGVKMLNAIQDVYLSNEISIA